MHIRDFAGTPRRCYRRSTSEHQENPIPFPKGPGDVASTAIGKVAIAITTSTLGGLPGLSGKQMVPLNKDPFFSTGRGFCLWHCRILFVLCPLLCTAMRLYGCTVKASTYNTLPERTFVHAWQCCRHSCENGLWLWQMLFLGVSTLEGPKTADSTCLYGCSKTRACTLNG